MVCLSLGVARVLKGNQSCSVRPHPDVLGFIRQIQDIQGMMQT